MLNYALMTEYKRDTILYFYNEIELKTIRKSIVKKYD